MHGITFGGHPVGCAVALKNLDIMERERVLENVMANEPWLRAQLDAFRSIPIVGDVRGLGHFWAIQLTAAPDGEEPSSQGDRDWLRDRLAGMLEARGLIARVDDRVDPMLQLSPPLVADRELLGEIIDIVGTSLEDAGQELARRAG